MFFKIFNKEENHHGFQYKTGVNIDCIPFNPTGTCSKGGLYFTDGDNICEFLSYGCYIRQVKAIGEIYYEESKAKCHELKLYKRRKLSDVNTWQWMIDNDVNVIGHINVAIIEMCSKGYLDVVKFLIENVSSLGILLYDTTIENAIESACFVGHLDVVKFLIERGFDVVGENLTIISAARQGHLDIVKLLIDNGADVTSRNNLSLVSACENGYFDIAKLLIDSGADVRAYDSLSLIKANKNHHLDIAELLLANGATFTLS